MHSTKNWNLKQCLTNINNPFTLSKFQHIQSYETETLLNSEDEEIGYLSSEDEESTEEILNKFELKRQNKRILNLENLSQSYNFDSVTGDMVVKFDTENAVGDFIPWPNALKRESSSDDSWSSDNSCSSKEHKIIPSKRKLILDGSGTELDRRINIAKVNKCPVHKPSTNIGSTRTVVVEPYYKDGRLNKYGRPKAHHSDRVQCDVCASVYRRNTGTLHRKTQKHQLALKVRERDLQFMLGMKNCKNNKDMKKFINNL